jgi:hypothetical protein
LQIEKDTVPVWISYDDMIMQFENEFEGLRRITEFTE